MGALSGLHLLDHRKICGASSGASGPAAHRDTRLPPRNHTPQNPMGRLPLVDQASVLIRLPEHHRSAAHGCSRKAVIIPGEVR